MAQAISRMAEKLVHLGYATRTAAHSETGMLQILFTPMGLALQQEISRIFESVTAGERFEFDELQAFMVILTMKPGYDRIK